MNDFLSQSRSSSYSSKFHDQSNHDDQIPFLRSSLLFEYLNTIILVIFYHKKRICLSTVILISLDTFHFIEWNVWPRPRDHLPIIRSSAQSSKLLLADLRGIETITNYRIIATAFLPVFGVGFSVETNTDTEKPNFFRFKLNKKLLNKWKF